MRTVGFSNKVFVTVLAAVSTQLVAFVVNLVATGVFDRVAAAQLVGVGLTAVFGVLAGYQAAPSETVFDPAIEVPGGSVAVHGEA